MRSRDALIFSLIAALLVSGSCGPTSLLPRDFRSAYRQVRSCRPTVEHQAPAGVPTRISSINVWVNPESADAYMNNVNPLPPNTVVIKEEHSDSNCNSLVSYSIARKVPGFDPQGGDWHWQHVLANGAIDADGRDNRCSNVSCHGAGACLRRDWMCTEP